MTDGYCEEEVDGRLYFEDVDEDSELWLIRVPSDIELSDVDRKKIYLGRKSTDVNLTNIKTENGKILECCAENCEIQNVCVLLPEKDSKKLQVVRKVFKGAILISEGLSSNEDTEVKFENAEDSQSASIDDSISSPHISKGKKKNKTSHNSDVNYEEEITDNVNLTTKRKSSKGSEGLRSNEDTDVKIENAEDSQSVTIDDSISSPHISKRKKKNKTSHNSDVNYEEEITDIGNLSTKRKSSKSSEVSNLKAKIKTEPELFESDEFPFCTSQN